MTLDPARAAVRHAVRRSLAGLDTPAVLVACSGGADSLALAAATVFESRSEPWKVVGVTVDHGLQEGSAEHAARVVEQLAALGVDETVSARVDVVGEGRGPEAAAREARYTVLAELAERLSAGAVLLGHTLDDQAETVLLGLARGSGGRSIAGMRPAYDVFRRPLLGLRRSVTEAACRADGLEWWDDPHNTDPRFLRSQVRHDVLPVLERVLGPGVAETLARTAEQLRPDMELLDALADDALAACRTPDGLSVDALAALAPSLRTRVLRSAAVEAGAPAGELFHDHVVAMDELVTAWRGQKWVDLPGHLRVVRRDGLLRWERGDGWSPG